MQNKNIPEISVVTTMYKSSPYLHEFYNRVLPVIKKHFRTYEIIFVDDGSPDDSVDKVKQLQEVDSNVVLVELSRNFGHHKAIMTGLKFTKGKYIYLLDCDLEEDPELLELFWNEMNNAIINEEELDVVYGKQERRKGGLLEKVSGQLFYKFINSLSDVKIEENLILARLMSRRYVNNLIMHRERNSLCWSLRSHWV